MPDEPLARASLPDPRLRAEPTDAQALKCPSPPPQAAPKKGSSASAPSLDAASAASASEPGKMDAEMRRRWIFAPISGVRLFFIASFAAFAEELFGVSLAPVSEDERARAHFFLRGLSIVAITLGFFLYARPEQQREAIAEPATAQRVRIAEQINQCVANGRCVGPSEGASPTNRAIDLTRLPSGSIACLNAPCDVARDDKGPQTHLSAATDGALRVWARADRGAAIGFAYRPSMDAAGVHWRKEALPPSLRDTGDNPLKDSPAAVPR